MDAERAGPARRPTPQEVAAAVGRGLPDIIGPGLRVLFCGYNPGLYSAAVGLPFARKGSRFWPALHGGGFTDRQLHPWEHDELLRHGLGITSLSNRATARADELTSAELVAGVTGLAVKAERYRPRWVAILGVTAYRIAFARPKAGLGPRPDRLGPARVWVLPNPSGLNAHFPLPALTAEFAKLRRELDA
ncbi:G/U mismatch-specific DNA glycosylase [Micromonospora noduli]|uniref:G/U mismatch-specific DNA glycosylase n=1 Tax=Micromonospora noduli TaxID=709876 RepID=UPI000DBF6D0C|nr:G/U mismatch-specific DNA glycosylase [Micromonospora noduli]KAB1913420.1 G/U mismatch-specific DNA glycosylase [Micromonospora noduli]RAO01036.1 G/U mismatch-specific DNA glycosylase [Micromonospora noduli]